MLDQKLIDEILSQCEQQELNSIWNFAETVGHDFTTRRQAFLWILERLLQSGRIKLKHIPTQQFLSGSLKEQIALFDAFLPKTALEADSALSGLPEFAADIGKGPGMQYWFFDTNCPAGIAWLIEMPDGKHQWH